MDGVGAVDRRRSYRPAAARAYRRLVGHLAAVGTVVVGVALLLPAGPAAGQPEVNLVTVSGIDLAAPLAVSAEEQPELCATLYAEVSWLIGEDGTASEPEPETLGPQYVLVAHQDGEPRHRFHLYPLAEGGPRVFRPVEQPGDRTVDEGWFFGRLSLPESLGTAGAPLTGVPPVTGGGTGGGQRPPVDQSEPPDPNVLAALDEWRQGMLLAAGVTVIVVAGLAGAAYLIRRKV